MAESEYVISVRDVRKKYRTGLFRRKTIEALKGVTLDVPRGQIFGLLGPNGAGKTTLIKILLGIVKRTGGDATVLGLPAGSQQSRARIGYLPENHRIPRHLNGETALEYYGSLSGMPMSEIRQRRPELLEIVGLKGREKESVTGYSKGMQQRLGLAQAMLHNPDLIILDEPTDGVDPVGRKEIREVLKRLATEGHSVFLNSHLLQELELVCDSVAILVGGEVRCTGKVPELKKAIFDAPLIVEVLGDREVVDGLLPESNNAQVSEPGNGLLHIEISRIEDSEIDGLIDRLRKNAISIRSVKRMDLTLEEAFLRVVEPVE
ncbi:MAG: ABC transporter ATP-binding protein [Planctomycetaceae bacterium]